MKEKIFTVLNDSQIVCAIWDNVKKPIGIIQIVHGIYDNIRTYNRFAKFMNKNGYIVFGTDCPPCGDKNDSQPCIFDKSVKLQIKIMNYLSNKYRIPVFIFGFGYGGLITQSILQKSTIPAAGVCLTNTGKYPSCMIDIAIVFTWICAKIFGENASARILNRIIIGKRHIQPEVKCTYGFYMALFQGIKTIRPESAFNTPILMISGAHDSISVNPRFSQSLYNAYRNNGITHITMIIYPDKRDNLLLEMNFGSIPNQVLDFLNHARASN